MARRLRPSPTDVDFNSAAALKSLRERTGLTQTAFAQLVHMNQADLSKYERGTHSMTMRRLADIAERAGSRLTVHIEARAAKPSARIPSARHCGALSLKRTT